MALLLERMKMQGEGNIGHMIEQVKDYGEGISQERSAE